MGNWRQLRQLFATMLVFYKVSQPSKVQGANKEILMEDILKKLRRKYHFS